MRLLRISVFFFFTLTASSGLFATGEDSLNVDVDVGENLDSLLNLWYVKNLPDTLFLGDSSWAFNDSAMANIPDSVMISRFRNLFSFIPLTYNEIVRNFIGVYILERRELVERMLGLSEYYFPMIEEILDRYDLPLELKYCAIIESALNPRAVSRAGATGIWQFMYGTGKMYGLTINSFVDERRDPVRSTEAAARFMKDLYEIYRDWILVIAAYNCGPGNVRRAIRRAGGRRDFWKIYYYLPRETRGHVPAFMAAFYVMHYYKEHGLLPGRVELPIPSDTVRIREALHLEQVSKVLGIPMKLLRDMNPQYRRNIIPPDPEEGYALKLPLEYTGAFIELQDSILACRDSVYFPDDIYKIPAPYRRSAYVPPPPAANMKKLYYTVKPGDNLGYIAEWYRTRASRLRYWNNIRGSMIRSGQKLLIYVPESKMEEYSRINEMSFGQKQRMIGATAGNSQRKENGPADPDGPFVYYRVKSGDTLWEIAGKFEGVSYADLMELNNIRDGRDLVPGQVLRIKPES